MKFIVSSTGLFSHLQAISRVINSKNSLPILDCFLLELTDGAKPLIAEVERLLGPDGAAIRAEMGEKIRQFAVPDSNKLIYNDLCRLAKK